MDLDEIKAGLRERGIKQVDLANALGILPKAVSLALSGQRQIKTREMDIIRSLLGQPPGAGVGGAAVRTIPVIGQVSAGRWREATAKAAAQRMPAPDPALPASAVALDVEGDSMDLFVPDGGRIIFDPDDRALYPRRFYVVLNEQGETTFKRFFADPARLEPCSSNSDHKAIVLGEGEVFTVVGRVIWQASRMPD